MTIVLHKECIFHARNALFWSGSQYAQSLLLALLNSAMPTIVRILVGIEDFRPATAEKVILSKLFIVRILSVGTFFSRLVPQHFTHYCH